MQENCPPEGLILIQSPLLAEESPFLVEEGAWYNLNNSIFSNRLSHYVLLAVIIMISEAILIVPLSLLVTVPMFFFAIQVSNSESKILL